MHPQTRKLKSHHRKLHTDRLKDEKGKSISRRTSKISLKAFARKMMTIGSTPESAVQAAGWFERKRG